MSRRKSANPEELVEKLLSGDRRAAARLITIMDHQAHLHETRKIDEVRNKRIEQELGLVFKDEVEKVVFAGIKGTGKKREYIEAIRAGKSDPYSVVKEVLSKYLVSRK